MKRRRELGLEQGRAAAAEIVKLDARYMGFKDKVTRLPYPGLGLPPDRPPMEFDYIGTDSILDLLGLFDPNCPRLVISGPRGHGKSSDLRALAVTLYNLGAPKERLVCIWNTRAMVDHVVEVVRDGLLFSYMVASEHEKEDERVRMGPGASSSDLEVEIQKIVDAASQVEAQIQGIGSISDAVKFIERRKREFGEVFQLFVDGWEYVDGVDSKGVKKPRKAQRVLAENQLRSLFALCQLVWLSASAKANETNDGGCDTYMKSEPLEDVQFKQYAILGKLTERKADIEYYTGYVPLFLDVLRSCCISHLISVRRHATRDALRQRMFKAELVVGQEARTHISDEDVVRQFEGDEGDERWTAALARFREHYEIKRVETISSRVVLEECCCSIEDMGQLDPTYYRAEKESYSSRYVRDIYTAKFRDCQQ